MFGFRGEVRENIGVARGPKGAMALAKFLEYRVILCFERRYPKQNTVVNLKSKVFAPKVFGSPKFWSGYATAWKGICKRAKWEIYARA